jgi:hypothetical protein
MPSEGSSTVDLSRNQTAAYRLHYTRVYKLYPRQWDCSEFRFQCDFEETLVYCQIAYPWGQPTYAVGR